MSLYGNYLTEKTNKEIIERDFGFVIFSFDLKPNENSVYIEDIYVLPKFRKEGFARMLADSVATKAKEKGVTKMYGSVIANSPGSTDSLKVLLSYGMKLDSCTNNFIVFSKEI